MQPKHMEYAHPNEYADRVQGLSESLSIDIISVTYGGPTYEERDPEELEVYGRGIERNGSTYAGSYLTRDTTPEEFFGWWFQSHCSDCEGPDRNKLIEGREYKPVCPAAPFQTWLYRNGKAGEYGEFVCSPDEWRTIVDEFFALAEMNDPISQV